MSSAMLNSSSNATEAGSTAGTVGGYSPVAVTNVTTALLTKALGNDELYAADVPTRLCFTTIDSIKSQVVAGTNYQYTVEACPVKAAVDGQGKCGPAVASCQAKQYTITIFEQKWTDTVTVSEIKLTSSQATGSGSKNKDSSTAPAPTANTPTPSKSAGRRTSLGVAVVFLATLGLASIAA